jgi:hypothetical protein
LRESSSVDRPKTPAARLDCALQKEKPGAGPGFKSIPDPFEDGLKASKGGYSLHQLSVTAAFAILVIVARSSNPGSRMLAMRLAHSGGAQI